MVPITYNFRNLVERKATTLLTALGIGLTVAVLVTSLALTEGLRVLFAGSGDERQALVLRKGANAELSSEVTNEAYQIISRLPGIAADVEGGPLVSPEGFVVANLTSSYSDGMNVSVRGLLPVGLKLRQFQIIRGALFEPGRHQVVVGESIEQRYPDAQLGKNIMFGKSPWEVVGIFHAADQSANSEIWCDLNQLRGDFERAGGSSSLLIRLESPASFESLKKTIEADQRLGVTVQREKEYYAGMTASGLPLEYLGYAVAVIMAVGSAFAATNTMYAAVARRSKEIGTLRALGFSRAAILLSFIMESVCLALIGGILGVLLALPINGLATGVGNFSTFTDVTFQFRVSPMAMCWGLAFAGIIGALGGFLPAYGASKKDIVQAMRDA
jgi:putative ABC transport system permease protein